MNSTCNESEGNPLKKKQKAEPGRASAEKLQELLSKLLPLGEVLPLTTLAAIQIDAAPDGSIHSEGTLETQEGIFE